ncbi:hypothetical protein ADUPG1_008224 [Aduncisulcus paluster]|uniref:VWFA domain-containing protein n=1 Tax=Aduncisulcus paluster TaxID=2918883 RepID=A0ABQ5KR65_9EUKA|nr:hypothetical protein ADUPG1_008224 [Aduncisulcus paluster]
MGNLLTAESDISFDDPQDLASTISSDITSSLKYKISALKDLRDAATKEVDKLINDNCFPDDDRPTAETYKRSNEGALEYDSRYNANVDFEYPHVHSYSVVTGTSHEEFFSAHLDLTEQMKKAVLTNYSEDAVVGDDDYNDIYSDPYLGDATFVGFDGGYQIYPGRDMYYSYTFFNFLRVPATKSDVSILIDVTSLTSSKEVAKYTAIIDAVIDSLATGTKLHILLLGKNYIVPFVQSGYVVVSYSSISSIKQLLAKMLSSVPSSVVTNGIITEMDVYKAVSFVYSQRDVICNHVHLRSDLWVESDAFESSETCEYPSIHKASAPSSPRSLFSSEWVSEDYMFRFDSSIASSDESTTFLGPTFVNVIGNTKQSATTLKNGNDGSSSSSPNANDYNNSRKDWKKWYAEDSKSDDPYSDGNSDLNVETDSGFQFMTNGDDIDDDSDGPCLSSSADSAGKGGYTCPPLTILLISNGISYSGPFTNHDPDTIRGSDILKYPMINIVCALTHPVRVGHSHTASLMGISSYSIPEIDLVNSTNSYSDSDHKFKQVAIPGVISESCANGLCLPSPTYYNILSVFSYKMALLPLLQALVPHHFSVFIGESRVCVDGTACVDLVSPVFSSSSNMYIGVVTTSFPVENIIKGSIIKGIKEVGPPPLPTQDPSEFLESPFSTDSSILTDAYDPLHVIPRLSSPCFTPILFRASDGVVLYHPHLTQHIATNSPLPLTLHSLLSEGEEYILTNKAALSQVRGKIIPATGVVPIYLSERMVGGSGTGGFGGSTSDSSSTATKYETTEEYIMTKQTKTTSADTGGYFYPKQIVSSVPGTIVWERIDGVSGLVVGIICETGCLRNHGEMTDLPLPTDELDDFSYNGTDRVSSRKLDADDNPIAMLHYNMSDLDSDDLDLGQVELGSYGEYVCDACATFSVAPDLVDGSQYTTLREFTRLMQRTIVDGEESRVVREIDANWYESTGVPYPKNEIDDLDESEEDSYYTYVEVRIPSVITNFVRSTVPSLYHLKYQLNQLLFYSNGEDAAYYDEYGTFRWWSLLRDDFLFVEYLHLQTRTVVRYPGAPSYGYDAPHTQAYIENCSLEGGFVHGRPCVTMTQEYFIISLPIQDTQHSEETVLVDTVFGTAHEQYYSQLAEVELAEKVFANGYTYVDSSWTQNDVTSLATGGVSFVSDSSDSFKVRKPLISTHNNVPSSHKNSKKSILAAGNGTLKEFGMTKHFVDNSYPRSSFITKKDSVYVSTMTNETNPNIPFNHIKTDPSISPTAEESTVLRHTPMMVVSIVFDATGAIMNNIIEPVLENISMLPFCGSAACLFQVFSSTVQPLHAYPYKIKPETIQNSFTTSAAQVFEYVGTGDVSGSVYSQMFVKALDSSGVIASSHNTVPKRADKICIGAFFKEASCNSNSSTSDVYSTILDGETAICVKDFVVEKNTISELQSVLEGAGLTVTSGSTLPGRYLRVPYEMSGEFAYRYIPFFGGFMVIAANPILNIPPSFLSLHYGMKNSCLSMDTSTVSSVSLLHEQFFPSPDKSSPIKYSLLSSFLLNQAAELEEYEKASPFHGHLPYEIIDVKISGVPTKWVSDVPIVEQSVLYVFGIFVGIVLFIWLVVSICKSGRYRNRTKLAKSLLFGH